MTVQPLAHCPRVRRNEQGRQLPFSPYGDAFAKACERVVKDVECTSIPPTTRVPSEREYSPAERPRRVVPRGCGRGPQFVPEKTDGSASRAGAKRAIAFRARGEHRRQVLRWEGLAIQ